MNTTSNLKSLFSRPEAELLLQCARVELDAAANDRVKALLTDRELDLDLDLLFALAQRNGLLPLLSHHLLRTAPDSLPDASREFLHDYFRKNSAFNLLLTGELLRLINLFENAGIQAMAYKGPALAVPVYGYLSLRQFCDLDILVRKQDVWAATELLEQQGFEPHFDISPAKREAFLRLGYVRLFRRDAGRTIVELHWRLAPRFFGVAWETDDFWSRLETIELRGARVQIPAPADLLLMLCVHAAKDFWEKLEWVTCVAELLRRHRDLDWQAIEAKASELHCSRALFLGLLLARDLLQAQLPASIEERLESFPSVRRLAQQACVRFIAPNPAALPFASRLSFHLRTKDRLSDRIRYCSRLALTTTPVDWAATPLPNALNFLYLPLRAVRLAKRYGLDAR